jgi:hypothetical protein
MKKILSIILLTASALTIHPLNAQTRTDSSQTEAPSMTAGELEEMAVVLVAFKNRSLDMQKQYEAALETSGWNSLMDAERLSRDAGFVQSKQIVANGKNIYKQYSKKAFSIIDQTDKGFKKIKFTSSEGKKFSTRIGGEMNALRALAQIHWDLERKIMLKMEDMIILLSTPAVAWTVEEQQIVFRNERDNKKFEQCIKDLAQLIEQQQELKE